MKKIIILIIPLVTFLFACKEKLELNAEWKDITLVYGLLNPNDSAHYIKLNKVFGGDGNAYTMAAVSDSVHYANATVYLEQWKNGVKKSTIPMYRTTEIQKDPGIFSTLNNYLYKAKATLDIESEYKLKILLPGKDTVSSSTRLVQDILVEYPNSIQAISFTNYNVPFKCKFKSAKYGKIYELVVRFHYDEINTLTHDTIAKSIDWKQPTKISAGSMGGENIQIDMSCEAFYSNLEAFIAQNQNVVRVPHRKTFEFIIYAGGDELNTYIEVSRPSEGLSQDKPTYTNISNGIGLFSCRSVKTLSGMRLSETTNDSLSRGKHTKLLNFYDADQTFLYWSQTGQTK